VAFNTPIWKVIRIPHITDIRLRHGFAFLVAIMDWFNRYLLAWKSLWP
jgi:hypothetical protein